MSGYISWDRAALETPKKSGQAAGDGLPESDSVEIPTERIVREDDAPSVESVSSGEDAHVVDSYVPEYRDSRELPMQHSGARSDDSDDADDMVPPRRPSAAGSSTGVPNPGSNPPKKPSESLGSRRKGPEEKKSTKKSKSDADKQQTGTAQIRDFPRSLLVLARAEFPNASNNTDALAAYVLAKSGRSNLDVPESVAELVKDWNGDKTLENMERRISALTNQVVVLLGLMQEMELLTTFIAFDRLGYRQEVASDIRNVDFLENGVTDLMTRLREQNRALRKQEAIKNGRPIR